MKPRFNIIDLFSGAGGLSLGFQKAGFNPILAIDNDAAALKTYARNFGDHAFSADISELNKKKIQKMLGGKIQDIHGIIGGPPCQGFSVQRRGTDSDHRNDLVLDFIRLVTEIRPAFFLMENVSGLLSKRGKTVLEKVKRSLSKAKYDFQIEKLDASHFGVPQARKRVFIVGYDTTIFRTPYSFPPPIQAFLKKPRTVRDAIGDLIDKDEAKVPNHKADKLSGINLERIRSIKAGQGRDSLPNHLQLPCHKGNKAHRHLDTYGRMEWSKVAPTITARFDSFSRGRFGHPSKDRTITLREGARLQSFPDNFIFQGSKVEVARQIGNAVPPLLAEAIAESIMSYLIENQSLELEECA